MCSGTIDLSHQKCFASLVLLPFIEECTEEGIAEGVAVASYVKLKGPLMKIGGKFWQSKRGFRLSRPKIRYKKADLARV